MREQGPVFKGVSENDQRRMMQATMKQYEMVIGSLPAVAGAKDLESFCSAARHLAEAILCLSQTEVSR